MSMRLAAMRIGLALMMAAPAAAALAQGSPPPQAEPSAASPTGPSVTPLGEPGAASPDAGSAPAGSPAAPATPAPTAPAASEPAPATAPTAPEVPAASAAAPEGLDAGTAVPPAGEPLASAPDAGIEVTELDPALPHDLSPWGMFMAADWVVKAVMIGLVFASLVTWTVWLAKAVELSLAKTRARRQVHRIEQSSSLSAALTDGKRPLRKGPVAALARSAAAEAELSGALPADGVKERVAVALSRIEARSGRHMARGTGLLATIGSTAPFVGLFGTVWGIMNSFIGIAETNTTNLAIVAPGIAEALLATGIGLVAAIPAVIIYNVFARSIAGYRAILADGSAAVLRHLSRDLDRRDAGFGGAPRATFQPAE